MIREKREKALKWSTAEKVLNELTLEFAEYFKKDNERFDENRFIEACGFKP
jgi:hypothetical protein